MNVAARELRRWGSCANDEAGATIRMMTHEELLGRVTLDPAICAGKPCIRGTRIYIAIILDALAEGMTPEHIVEEYPSLTLDDIHAALAYSAELARENVWKIAPRR